MKRISCIVIDDEPLALGLIESYVKRTPFLELAGAFDNPIDAMEFLQDMTVQLIFLDIQMPDFTGVDFARGLSDETKVIFITAYERYAIEGFRLHALDYLLKPVSYETFLKSANYAQKSIYSTSVLQNNEENVNCDDSYMFIKVDGAIRRINYMDILYFEGLKDYIKLYLTTSTSPLVFYATMKSLECHLPATQFMRVHRSFIVNLEQVTTIERSRIILGKEYIPISKQYKDDFDDFVRQRFL